VVEVLEDHANIFIISEKTAGGDVGEWTARVMEEGNWLQERTAAEYIRQILIALARAHACGIRHGDLRPSSLALTSKLPDAHVLLCDLGLAGAIDPDGSSICWNANPYTAPELLPEEGGGAAAAPSADLWSLGAVAHALLVGHAPSRESSSWRGRRSFIEPRREGSCWVERTALGYDFVKGLLHQAPESRPTAAAALQHPWLRGFSEVQSARGGISEEAQHTLLGYMLAVLLLPELIKPRELRQLVSGFERLDSDHDGYVSSHLVPRLLADVGAVDPLAAAAAVEIVDVNGVESLDACSVACACAVARAIEQQQQLQRPPASPLQGSSRGQRGSPRSPADVARRLLKQFFQTYADGDRQEQVSLRALRSKLRSADARNVEAKVGVRYSEVLAGLPDVLDTSALLQELVAGGGRGTPLAVSEELAVEGEMESCLAEALGITVLSELLGALLRSCGLIGGGHGKRRKMMLQS